MSQCFSAECQNTAAKGWINLWNVDNEGKDGFYAGFDISMINGSLRSIFVLAFSIPYCKGSRSKSITWMRELGIPRGNET